MRWSDTGIVIATSKSTEHSLIVTIFTIEHGLYKGYCSFNKKNMPTLQVGNVVAVSWNARLSTHLGRWQFELIESIPAFFLHNYHKMMALSAVTKTIGKVLPEREVQTVAYEQFYILMAWLKNADDWQGQYVKLELIMLEKLGFGLDFSQCPVHNTTTDLAFISPKTGRVISRAAGMPYKSKLLSLPPILRQVYYNEVDVIGLAVDFAQCLAVINYFLYKHCFHPHNIAIPIERQLLYDAYCRN